MTRLVLPIASLALAIGLSPVAHADTDSDYLGAVRSHGFEVYGDGSVSIANAKTVCAELKSGTTRTAAENQWFAADQGKDAISHADAAFLVSTAIRYYCPGAA